MRVALILLLLTACAHAQVITGLTISSAVQDANGNYQQGATLASWTNTAPTQVQLVTSMGVRRYHRAILIKQATQLMRHE